MTPMRDRSHLSSGLAIVARPLAFWSRRELCHVGAFRSKPGADSGDGLLNVGSGNEKPGIGSSRRGLGRIGNVLAVLVNDIWLYGGPLTVVAFGCPIFVRSSRLRHGLLNLRRCLPGRDTAAPNAASFVQAGDATSAASNVG